MFSKSFPHFRQNISPFVGILISFPDIFKFELDMVADNSSTLCLKQCSESLTTSHTSTLSVLGFQIAYETLFIVAETTS